MVTCSPMLSDSFTQLAQRFTQYDKGTPKGYCPNKETEETSPYCYGGNQCS